MKARNNKSTLRRLSRDILNQRSLLVIATVGTIIQVALTVYLPILIGDAGCCSQKGCCPSNITFNMANACGYRS